MSVSPISEKLRTAVIERDGSRCLACRVQCTWSGPNKLHIDHIVPEALGGRTVLDNLQVLCRTCNLRKGAETMDYRSSEEVMERRESFRDSVIEEADYAARLAKVVPGRGAAALLRAQEQRNSVQRYPGYQPRRAHDPVACSNYTSARR